MGFAFPAALAAQLDFPEKQVICIAGDGGFGMAMADFTTAVLYNLPIKVILFNDNKFKNVKKTQIWRRYKEFGTELVNPRFSDFAKSCGGEGFRVDKPEELDKTMKEAFTSDKPAILEIIVDREKLAPW
jgi:pyruvate oxidase